MNRVKKLFVADNEQTGSGVRNQVKSTLLEILIKLSKCNGFNEEGHIRDSNGTFLPGTDVGTLASYAVSHEKIMRGKKRFASLLHEAGVNPVKIANENLRKHMPATSLPDGGSGPATRPPSPGSGAAELPPPPPLSYNGPARQPEVIAMPPVPPPLRMETGRKVIRSKDVEVRPEDLPLPDDDDDDPEVIPPVVSTATRKGSKRSIKPASINKKKRVFETYEDDSE